MSNEAAPAPTNRDYAQLKTASADLHYWYGRRNELVDELARAERDLANVDEGIANAATKIRDALAALRITSKEEAA